jgi:hypothetical protein
MCGVELESHPIRTKCCGCDNLTTVKDDKISAIDLSQVVMLNSIKEKKQSSFLTSQDLQFQESRKQRKIRKIDFEER